mmetsp:Transcript_3331/g.4444  ORF Transcript_3331/g.4444 Transcript_3331/m.4444 type:complete len:866 (+) Transcript_3331:288-2885(+)
MNNPNSNKKAVHVKWAGKTIALGTFPIAEADEKCARAKALTRAWRSTMRPKPTREWVMTELERLNVRVVSGRPSKEAGLEDEENDSSGLHGSGVGPGGGGAGGSMNGNGNSNSSDFLGRRSSITASLLNAAELARGLGLDSNQFMSQRRNSSLPMSLFGDGRDSSIGGLGSGMLGKNDQDYTGGMSGNDHRPLVGGGSAAAYEAARADHYRMLAEQKNKSPRLKDDVRGDLGGHSNSLVSGSSGQGSVSARRLSSIGMDNLFSNASSNQMGDMFSSSSGNGNGVGNSFGLSVNPNAHYEMLKLHHMNLLNEIQETTLMMNLYQQQQVQQQQQQRKLQQEQQQQQQLLAQQQLLNNQSRSNSLGLGSSFMNGHGHGHNQNHNHSRTNASSIVGRHIDPQISSINNSSSSSKGMHREQHKSNTSPSASSELHDHEEKLRKIKEEIEERKRMLEDLEKNSTLKQSKIKRKNSLDSDDDDDDEPIAAMYRGKLKAPSSMRAEDFDSLAQIDLTTPLRDDEVMPKHEHRVVPDRSVVEVAESTKKKKKNKKSKVSKKNKDVEVSSVEVSNEASNVRVNGAGGLDLLDFSGLSMNHGNESAKSNPINNAFDDLLALDIPNNNTSSQVNHPMDIDTTSGAAKPNNRKKAPKIWYEATIKVSKADGDIVDWNSLTLLYRTHLSKHGRNEVKLSYKINNNGASGLQGIKIQMEGSGVVEFESVDKHSSTAESSKIGPFSVNELRGTLTASGSSVPIKVILPVSYSLSSLPSSACQEDVANMLSTGNWASSTIKLNNSSELENDKIKAMFQHVLQAKEVENNGDESNSILISKASSGAIVLVLLKIGKKGIKADVKSTDKDLAKTIASSIKRIVL